MTAEREKQIRRAHANCDTPDKPCDAEDLLAALDAEREKNAKLAASLYCPRCHARPHIPDVLKDNFSFPQWLAQHPCGYQGPDHD